MVIGDDMLADEGRWEDELVVGVEEEEMEEDEGLAPCGRASAKGRKCRPAAAARMMRQSVEGSMFVVVVVLVSVVDWQEFDGKNPTVLASHPFFLLLRLTC